MKHIPNIKMPDNTKVPSIGLGLWLVRGEDNCIETVTAGIEAGYTHFDSAQVYGNEKHLGKALKSSGQKREDIFVTTKISVTNFLRVKSSFDKSLEKLQLEYVDLLLLHFPVTGVRGKAWKDLEDIHAEGKAKSIGVSNYTVRHLKQLLKNCKVKPAVNQVELHVFLQQPELVEFCKENDILVEAYSPLAHGKGLDDPVLVDIAKKHGKSTAQIMIRWCLDIGTLPLPKSTNPERLKQNIDVFDFKLDADDMKKIKGLDRNLRTCWDPTHVV
jgi:diketogulonate reductase-like aldo/keto reductase